MSELKHNLGFLLEKIFLRFDGLWERIPPLEKPLYFLAASLPLCAFSFLVSLFPFWATLATSATFFSLFALSCVDLKPKRWDGQSSTLTFEFVIRTRCFLIYLTLSSLLSGTIGWEYPDSVIPHAVAAGYPLVLAMGIVGLLFQAQVMESTDPRYKNSYERVSRHEY